MSATTAPTQPASPKLDPVAFVAGLDGFEKHAVFLALLREAMEFNGDTGLIPVVDEGRRPFGYYVTPKASEELYRLRGPKFTEAEEEAIDKLLANPGPSIPIEDAIAELKRRLADLQQQP